MRIAYLVSLPILLLAGCQVSHVHYSFDDPSIYDGNFKLNGKYHIDSMQTRHIWSEINHETVMSNSRIEIEDSERLLPEVFNANGIPIRVEVDIEMKSESMASVLPKALVCLVGLWVIPVWEKYDWPTKVKVSSANMSGECETNMCSYNFSWVSLLGLGAIMPMPTPPDRRFASEYAHGALSGDSDEETILTANKAMAYAIAAALQGLETTNRPIKTPRKKVGR